MWRWQNDVAHQPRPRWLPDQLASAGCNEDQRGDAMILAASIALTAAIIIATGTVIYIGRQIPKQPGESAVERTVI